MSDKFKSDQKLPASIWALGLVSLLMDMSSEIIHSLLPLFLVAHMGATYTIVGVLEGVAEAIVLVFKTFSGLLSDLIGRRKPLVVIGYTMAAVSKPFFAVSDSISLIFSARLFDRIGKGIRGAPRDALIADLTPQNLRGRAYGLRQSLDTVGAFAGPLLAIFLMTASSNNYRLIFWLATIPALLSVLTILVGVQEEKPSTEVSNKKQIIRLEDIKNFSASFWFVVIAGAFFQLARFSEAFLILRANSFGLSPQLAPLTLIIMNIIYSLTAFPVGYFSDYVRREWFLAGGLCVLCLADLLLAMAQSLTQIFVAIMLWGLHMGLTQGIFAALVADTCQPQKRGSAYGVFNLFSAIALMLASMIAGILWDSVGAKATFFVGAILSFFSLIGFALTGSLWSKRI